jgi:hypothetical protein
MMFRIRVCKEKWQKLEKAESAEVKVNGETVQLDLYDDGITYTNPDGEVVERLGKPVYALDPSDGSVVITVA